MHTNADTIKPAADFAPAVPAQRAPGLMRRMAHALRSSADVEESFNLELVRAAATGLPATSMMLDAGAGNTPYARFFRHLRYESCDLYPSQQVTHQWLCDVQHLPMEDERYDGILCVQVLDDLRDPQLAMDGFQRVLRPGGRVYLSVPMATRLHAEPHHYFQFTRYGIELLATRAGLQVEWITPRGGIFTHFAYLFRKLPAYMRRERRWNVQQQDSLALRAAAACWNGLCAGAALLATPILSFVFPWLLRPFDALDKSRAFTLGYNACLRKPRSEAPAGVLSA
jgi:SAM-dependent methyltransferase